MLHNDGAHKNNVVRVTLQGTKSNRDGIGAHLKAKIGDRVLHRTVRSGSSYCSQSELPVTFGLAKNQKVDAITVVWPSGAKTELKNVISAKAIS